MFENKIYNCIKYQKYFMKLTLMTSYILVKKC